MKNWTIKEAVEAINKNDAAAIKEISKHFPMFFLAIARNDLQALAAMMPEKFTVRRLQMTDAAVDDNDEGAEPQTDADAEDASEDAGEADLSSMSTKELMKLCDKRGIKVPHYGKNKQFYLDALNGASGAKADTEDDADEDGEDESNPYEGKNAMELYKLCKKRGIKCEAKKKAAYYADLLTKDDAKSDEGESEDDGWGDEDEAQEEPKKAAKSSKKAEKDDKKPAAKAAKKETKKDEADDDEDWDI